METTGRKRTKITKQAVFATYEIVGDPPQLRDKSTGQRYTLNCNMIYSHEMGKISKGAIIFTLYFGFPPEQKLTPTYIMRVLLNNGEPGPTKAKPEERGCATRAEVLERLGETCELHGDVLVRKTDGCRWKFPGGKPSASKVRIGSDMHPLEWSAVFNYFKKRDAQIQQSSD